MDGAMITDTTSKAYEIISTLHVENGFYTDGEYIAVAMSNYYGQVGDRFKITLESGRVMKVIMADTKAPQHVENMCTSQDGSMLELIVDVSSVEQLYPDVALYGDFDLLFTGSVTKVERMIRDG